MSKERLEDTKISIGWDRNKLPPEILPHIDYLFEQAERVVELQETIKQSDDIMNEMHDKLEEIALVIDTGSKEGCHRVKEIANNYMTYYSLEESV